MVIDNHFKISMVKSVLRLIGYILLLVNIYYAVALLFLSEVIGILEEVYGTD